MLVVSVLTRCCEFILCLRSYYSQTVVHTDNMNEMIFRNMTQVDRDQRDVVVTTSLILPLSFKLTMEPQRQFEDRTCPESSTSHMAPFEATSVAFSSARLETPPEYTIFEFSD